MTWKLVAKKKYQVYSRYQYLSTSHDLGKLLISIDWKDTTHNMGKITYIIGKDISYHSIFVVV